MGCPGKRNMDQNLRNPSLQILSHSHIVENPEKLGSGGVLVFIGITGESSETRVS